MPSDKAMQLAGDILDNGVVTRCADLIDAHTAEAVAEYKCVLDEAEKALQDYVTASGIATHSIAVNGRSAITAIAKLKQ